MTLANSGIPPGQWSGADATRELHQTMQEFNAAANEQTKAMLRLTKVITVLTGAMLLLGIVQLIVALRP